MPDTYEAPFPHCDDLVLHAPGKCVHCDKYPARQQERIEQGIAFTGEPPTKGGPEKPCPSTQRRPLSAINRWPGNTPKPPDGKP